MSAFLRLFSSSSFIRIITNSYHKNHPRNPHHEHHPTSKSEKGLISATLRVLQMRFTTSEASVHESTCSNKKKTLTPR
jgi:hypothetical protein